MESVLSCFKYQTLSARKAERFLVFCISFYNNASKDTLFQLYPLTWFNLTLNTLVQCRTHTCKKKKKNWRVCVTYGNQILGPWLSRLFVTHPTRLPQGQTSQYTNRQLLLQQPICWYQCIFTLVCTTYCLWVELAPWVRVVNLPLQHLKSNICWLLFLNLLYIIYYCSCAFVLSIHCKKNWVTLTTFWSSRLHTYCARNLQFELKCSWEEGL